MWIKPRRPTDSSFKHTELLLLTISVCARQNGEYIMPTRGRKAHGSEVTSHTIRHVSWKSNNCDHGMQPWRVFSSFYRRSNKVLKNLISANGVIGNIFISEFHEPLQCGVSPKTQSGTVRLITTLIISDFCKKTRFRVN